MWQITFFWSEIGSGFGELGDTRPPRIPCSTSLQKHPFLLAVRSWGRFARTVPNGKERGETDVFAGYSSTRPPGICTMSFETIIACVADAKRGGGEGEKRESGEKGRERLLRRGWCICIAPTIFSTKPITSYVENGTNGK